MEIEEGNRLPFLDVLVIKKADGTLGHTVYRKKTHTDRYLNANSNHHPSQKNTVLRTLVNRARSIAEPGLVESELNHLKTVLTANGYSQTAVNREINRRPRAPELTLQHEEAQEPSQPKVFLPYIHKTTDVISKILKKKGIKTIFLPTTKIQQTLRSAKDPLKPLSAPGIYKVPCSCGSVYIGMTKRSVKTRLCEHERCLRLNQPEKSAVAQHAIENNHTIEFNQTEILAKPKGYFNLARREALEIEQHPNNFNRDMGYQVSRTWRPLLNNKQHGVTRDQGTPRPPVPVTPRQPGTPCHSAPINANPTPPPPVTQGDNNNPYIRNTRSRTLQLRLNF